MANGNCFLCDRAARTSQMPGKLDTALVECKACGRYGISGSLEDTVRTPPLMEQRYVLSGLTRRASDNGSLLELTTSNAPGWIASAPVPRTLPELLDQVLLRVVEKAPSLVGHTKIASLDYPQFFLRSADELGIAIHQLATLGLVHGKDSEGNHLVRATPAGWRHAEELRRNTKKGNQAFVAMWFNSELDDAYDSGIAPALQACGYTPTRVDRVEHNGKIDDEIVAGIRRSALIVADFTGHRPSVYFEAGFAQGLGIPVIWTCRSDGIADAHFDTRQYNHITWDTPQELEKKLVARVVATLPNDGRVASVTVTVE